MRREKLFLYTLRDLDRRLESSDEYEILMIAGLLRKLLLDGSPLIHLVNRTSRLKFTYRVSAPSDRERKALADPGLRFWALQDALDQDTDFAGIPAREVSEKELLARVVIIAGGHQFTVADVIRHLAHIEGGVHSGEPKDARERALRDIEERSLAHELPPVVQSLLAIGRVVRKGLEPLKQRIEVDFHLSIS